ncbi:hypothetical protein D3C73_1412120 [compost metagenome]
MLEIELKSGKAIDLWYFVQQLQGICNLEPCEDSKYSRAKKKLGSKSKIIK